MTDSTISTEWSRCVIEIYKKLCFHSIRIDNILFMWDFENNCWMYVSGIFNLSLGVIIGYH